MAAVDNRQSRDPRRLSVTSIVSEIWDSNERDSVSSTSPDSSRTEDSSSGRGGRSSTRQWQSTLTPLKESPEVSSYRALANEWPMGGPPQRPSIKSPVVEPVLHASAQLSPAALQFLEEAKASSRKSSVHSEEAFNVAAPLPNRMNGSYSAPSAQSSFATPSGPSSMAAPSGLSSNGSPPRMPSPPQPPSGRSSIKGEAQSEPNFASAPRQAMDIAIAGRFQGGAAGSDIVSMSPTRADSASPPVKLPGEEALSCNRGMNSIMTSPGRSSILSISAEDPDSARADFHRRDSRSPADPSQPRFLAEAPMLDLLAPLQVLSAEPPWDEKRLRDVYNYIDADGAGTIDRLKLVKACRESRDVAEFLGLPQQICQEDGSLDQLEKLFQGLDPNDNRVVSWDDFQTFFQKLDVGDSVVARSSEAPLLQTAEQPWPPLSRLGGDSEQSSPLIKEEQRQHRWTLEGAEDVHLRDVKPQERALKPQGEPEAEAAPDVASPSTSTVASAGGFPLPRSPENNTVVHERAAPDRVSQPGTAASAELAEAVAEARRQAQKAEEVMARANEEAQESQARARDLDAQNSKLQRDLQTVKAQVEERRRDNALRTEQQEAAACLQLLDAAGKLEIEAQCAAEATEALCLRGAELEQEAERLQTDQEDAVACLELQEAARSRQWSRLGAIAALRTGSGPPPGTPLHEVVAKIRREWTDARMSVDWRRRQRQELEGRRETLENELAVAQQALKQASSQLAASEYRLQSELRESRGRESLADEELAAARSEHKLLKQARAEWQRARPQLVSHLEELQAGNREGNGQTRDLSERLMALRHAVETNGKACGAATACWNSLRSDTLGQEDSISIAGSVDSRGLDASPGSIGDTEELLRLGGPRSSGSSADEEALRQAVEESDQLQKRVLILEDEKATLIREQEDLIQYIKTKVAPLQRALLVEA